MWKPCSLLKAISFTIMHTKISLIPRPRPAFRCFQYETGNDGKLGGAWAQGYVTICINYCRSHVLRLNVQLFHMIVPSYNHLFVAVVTHAMHS